MLSQTKGRQIVMKSDSDLADKLIHNKQKIKEIRVVWRGGSKFADKFMSKMEQSNLTDLKMNVDNDDLELVYQRTKTSEENKAPVVPHLSTVSKNNSANINPNIEVPNNLSQIEADRKDVIDYVSLITEITRKRKFTEISNSIRTAEESDVSLSRKERLIREINKSQTFPGKTMSSKMPWDNTEYCLDSRLSLNMNPEEHVLMNFRHKRMNTIEARDSVDELESIDMQKVRKEQAEFLEKHNLGPNADHSRS